MLVDTTERQVIYLSKKGEILNHTVKEILSTENEDLKKRFEYIKELLKER